MRLTLLSVIGLITAAPLQSQTVHGRLVATDSTPVAGAIVFISDSTGTPSKRILSSPIGSYLLLAPRPGTYTLRVLRIGYPSFTSAPFVIRGGELADFSPSLPDVPVVMTDLSVSAGSSCSAATTLGAATATLLDEVRKAFGSMELALADRDLQFQVRRFARRTDKNAVLVAQDSAIEMMSSWPVHSLPAGLLRDRGYVIAADSVEAEFLPYGASAGKVWFGPDPTTLFADPFLESHCYHLEVDRRDTTLVGLTFAPIRGRVLPDIAGTLWIDRRTFALRSLAYQYVHLPRQFREARNGAAGGKMEFLRLPSGLWAVSSWDLRVPVEEVYNNVPIGIGGYLQEGGRIEHVRTTRGVVIY